MYMVGRTGNRNFSLTKKNIFNNWILIQFCFYSGMEITLWYFVIHYNWTLRVRRTQDGRPKLRLLSAESPASRREALQISGESSSKLTQPSVILSLYILFSTQTLELGTSQMCQYFGSDKHDTHAGISDLIFHLSHWLLLFSFVSRILSGGISLKALWPTRSKWGQRS